MYYHPMMLNTLRRDRTPNIFRTLNDARFESIQRQRELQADAVATFYNANVDHARALTELMSTAELAIHSLARATSAQLKVLAVAAQLGEIAADTQRQAISLLQSQPPPAPLPALADTDHKERRTGSTELRNRKAQMMA